MISAINYREKIENCRQTADAAKGRKPANETTALLEQGKKLKDNGTNLSG